MTPYLADGSGLCKAFGGQKVLDNADFRIEQGDFILLCGDNGSGKTTFLNIVTGHLEADAGEIVYTGARSHIRTCFPRRAIDRLNPFDRFTPEALARLGFTRTWQDIRLFETQTVRENVGSSSNSGSRALGTDDVLRRVGLLEYATRPASQLSLGQAKRLSICRAIAGPTRVVFLDEPLSGLDRAGIEAITAILLELNRNLGVALVMVEHPLNYSHIANFVNKIWLLEDGRLLDSSKSHARPKRAALEQRETIVEGVAGKGATIVDEQLSGGAYITRIRPGRIPSSRVMLDVRSARIARGIPSVSETGVRVTDKFDIKLCEGEVAFLWAPNGWGKTTLCRGIAGLLPVAEGAIHLDGVRIDGMPPWQRAKKGLHALPADYAGFPNLRVSEALALSGAGPDSQELAPFASQRCGTLSGGQLQMLGLFTSMAGTGVLLLDEPFARLDAARVAKIIRMLKPSPSRAALILMPSY